MSRARNDLDTRQTAVASEEQGSGCLSYYMFPPLAVLILSALLAAFALNASVQAEPISTDSTAPLPTASSAISPAGLAAVFTPEVQYWSASISRWAAQADLDPNLVAVIMQIESCGDPSARSSAGAMGLFQVMPYHFLISDDPYDPDTNAARGLNYLKRSLSASGNDPRLVFAGYNGGISVISRDPLFWAAETTRYVYWGSGIYQDAVKHMTQSARLTEWLQAGGSGLCQRARSVLGING